MNKVIFLVGGPGSGKDIILKNILNTYNLTEFTLEQVNSTFVNKISENDKRFSILKTNSFVISTNAYNYENVKHTKNLLENFGYKTSMVYVDVEFDISKNRLKGRESFSESSWREKLTKSKENISNFNTLFEDFTKYDNNTQILNLNGLHIFCECFINEGQINFFEGNDQLNSTLLEKYSLKKKVFKPKKKNTDDMDGYPPEFLTKVKTDRIGDEYSIRNSGMGFPTTVGAVYSETFTDVADLTAFSSPERNNPPPETLPDPKSVQRDENKKRAIKSIKRVAMLSWKGK